MKRAASARELAVFCAVVLGAGAFVVAARARTNWDQDIWWHLRAGQWIVEHGTLPATDPFSQFGQGKSWIAYSWLFEVIAQTAHAWLGLRGLVVLSAVLGLLIAASLYVLVRGVGAPLAVAAALTLVGFDAMMPLTTPRPWLFSMLFFLIELCVIVAAWRDHSARIPAVLWLLPPVFILWANMHVQFVIGLLVLAAAAADALWDRRSTTPWLLMTAVCAVAVLVNPYHVGIYAVARQLTAQTQLWTRIGELQAPDFRHSTDWIVLAMTLTAAGSLGWQFRSAWRPPSRESSGERTWGPPSLARRSREAAEAAGGPSPHRVFLLLLFVFGAYLGFKSRRDTWLTVTGAACAIASAPWDTIIRPALSGVEGPRPQARLPGWLAASAASAMAVLLAFAAPALLSEEKLAANVARTYPVNAAAFIEQHARTGPLYNYFDWGGYLMWRLPHLPVQMDGRTIVHGEPRVLSHVDTWQGKPAWHADPELAAAKIVVGPRDLPLASLLRLDDRFRLIYEDPEGPAIVFEAR